MHVAACYIACVLVYMSYLCMYKLEVEMMCIFCLSCCEETHSNSLAMVIETPGSLHSLSPHSFSETLALKTQVCHMQPCSVHTTPGTYVHITSMRVCFIQEIGIAWREGLEECWLWLV